MKKNHVLRRLNPWAVFVAVWVLSALVSHTLFDGMTTAQFLLTVVSMPLLVHAGADLLLQGILISKE